MANSENLHETLLAIQDQLTRLQLKVETIRNNNNDKIIMITMTMKVTMGTAVNNVKLLVTRSSRQCHLLKPTSK